MKKLTSSQINEVAMELHRYVAYRAAREGVGYALDVPFFENILKQGCTKAFGINFNADGLVEDEQCPEFFGDWIVMQKQA
jgi:hypothetical protein